MLKFKCLSSNDGAKLREALTRFIQLVFTIPFELLKPTLARYGMFFKPPCTLTLWLVETAVRKISSCQLVSALPNLDASRPLTEPTSSLY